MNKLLRAQGQHEMAISFAKHIYESYKVNGEAADVYSVVVKWLAETPSSKLVIAAIVASG
ncbi:putative non-specific serine/threonine protein kinase [Helianthus annuus]|nr:putative non-specific serine/threonine protein kinase [Helianthus annuus]